MLNKNIIHNSILFIKTKKVIMPCSVCKQSGHNSRTCSKNILPFITSNPTKFMINIAPPPPTVCVICLEDIIGQPKTQLKCSHSFCTECLMKNISHGDTKCPLCRDIIIEPNIQMDDLKRQISSLESFNLSTQQQLHSITSELIKLNLNSLIDLQMFIKHYKMLQRNVSAQNMTTANNRNIPMPISNILNIINNVEEIN